MLRADQINRIAAGIGRSWTLLAGDAVTAVMQSGTTADVSESCVPGAIYAVTFEVEIEVGNVTVSIGGGSGDTVSESGEYTQQIIASTDAPIEFNESEDFDGAAVSTSVILVQKDLLTISIDKPIGNEFSDGLQIDNAGMMLHDGRELTFLSTYLSASGVDIYKVDCWLINGERWDFAKDAPIQTSIVPIAGIQNIVVVSVRKAVELEQTSSQAGDYTYG